MGNPSAPTGHYVGKSNKKPIKLAAKAAKKASAKKPAKRK